MCLVGDPMLDLRWAKCLQQNATPDSFVRWRMTSERFLRWSFPRHLQLFAELRQLEWEHMHCKLFQVDNEGDRFIVALLQAKVTQYIYLVPEL